jgi:hypothetical protein
MINLAFVSAQIQTLTKLIEFMSNHYRNSTMSILLCSYESGHELVELYVDHEVVGRVYYELPKPKSLLFRKLFTTRKEREYDYIITQLGRMIVRCEDDGITVNHLNVTGPFDPEISVILPEDTEASGSSSGY